MGWRWRAQHGRSGDFTSSLRLPKTVCVVVAAQLKSTVYAGVADFQKRGTIRNLNSARHEADLAVAEKDVRGCEAVNWRGHLLV